MTIREIASKAYRNVFDEALRNKLELYLGCSDYYIDAYKKTNCLFVHVPKAAGTSFSYALYGGVIANHYPASLYYNISEKEFKKYFSFSVVRNPWDRLVSGYEFIKQGGTKYVRPANREVFASEEFKTFDDFVTKILPEADLFLLGKVFFPQYHFVCDENKKVIVNFVGRYEYLGGTVNALSEQAGINIELPSINISNSRRKYQEFYSERTKKIVADVYSDDIDIFGYSFDD